VIPLGITVDIPLGLMRGFPEFIVQQGRKAHVVSSSGPGLHQLATGKSFTAHALKMSRQLSLVRDMLPLRLDRAASTSAIGRRFCGTPKTGLVGGVAARMAGVPHPVIKEMK
jgi:hypothetical protein